MVENMGSFLIANYSWMIESGFLEKINLKFLNFGVKLMVAAASFQ
jgi:hypothetical protein